MREAHRPWKSNELNQLMADYPTTPNPELARKYGRTRNAIERIAAKYKLHKTTTEEQVLKILASADGPLQVRVIAAHLDRDGNRATHYALKKLRDAGEVYRASYGFWGLVR